MSNGILSSLVYGKFLVKISAMFSLLQQYASLMVNWISNQVYGTFIVGIDDYSFGPLCIHLTITFPKKTASLDAEENDIYTASMLLEATVDCFLDS